jgi:hypothetical protein
MSVERGTCQHEKEKEEPMAIISPEDRQTLQTLFAQELQDDVNITYFTQRESVLIVPGQESSSCKETRELLEELTETALPHEQSAFGLFTKSPPLEVVTPSATRSPPGSCSFAKRAEVVIMRSLRQTIHEASGGIAVVLAKQFRVGPLQRRQPWEMFTRS